MKTIRRLGFTTEELLSTEAELAMCITKQIPAGRERDRVINLIHNRFDHYRSLIRAQAWCVNNDLAVFERNGE